jgi:hypothetical protein
MRKSRFVCRGKFSTESEKSAMKPRRIQHFLQEEPKVMEKRAV